MPTYEYLCLDCENKVEYFQSITAAPKTECPDCGGILKKMVTAGIGLIFKGSGFYETDYKHRDRENGKAKSLESADKPTENKAEVKSKSSKSDKE